LFLSILIKQIKYSFSCHEEFLIQKALKSNCSKWSN
jgi:hypothetical protein